jgi:hypothetical protein
MLGATRRQFGTAKLNEIIFELHSADNILKTVALIMGVLGPLRARTIVCRLNPVSNSKKARGIASSRFLSCSSATPVSEPYRTSGGISVLMSFCSHPRSVSLPIR